MKLKKSLIAGLVALGTIAAAGTASAASCNVPSQETYKVTSLQTFTTTNPQTVWNIAKQYGIDLNKLIGNPNEILQGIVYNNSNTPVAAKPAAQPAPTHAAQPASHHAAQPAAKPAAQHAAKPAAQSSYAKQVVSLVNQERAKAGLKPLTSDSALSGMALDKAKDMINKNYFDHNSPTYGSPFDMMKSYGIRYTYAGENIAKGQRTPQEVMNGWMNSSGHRQNILSPNYTKIGVGYYNGAWVQEFIAN